MTLTPAGEELFRNVETALALIDRGVEQARDVAATAKPSLVIGFSPSLGNRLVPELVPLLEQRLPSIVIDEREVDTGEVGPGVRDGRYDIGFAHCPSPEPGVVMSVLIEERMCIAVADSHPTASLETALLGQVSDLDLLLWPRETAPEYYDRILAICRQAGMEPRVARGARRALLRSYLLSRGQTFCLLPLSTALLQVPGVRFVPVGDPHALVPLVALTRDDDRRDELAEVEVVARELSARLLRPVGRPPEQGGEGTRLADAEGRSAGPRAKA